MQAWIFHQGFRIWQPPNASNVAGATKTFVLCRGIQFIVPPIGITVRNK